MSEFDLDITALCAETGNELEDVDIFCADLARQIEAAGGPSGSFEEQVRAMLGAWKHRTCDCGREFVVQCTVCDNDE